jgi:hypothetical protein
MLFQRGAGYGFCSTPSVVGGSVPDKGGVGKSPSLWGFKAAVCESVNFYVLRAFRPEELTQCAPQKLEQISLR